MAGFDWRKRLNEGVVIPAHPLALTSARKLDERYHGPAWAAWVSTAAGKKERRGGQEQEQDCCFHTATSSLPTGG